MGTFVLAMAAALQTVLLDAPVHADVKDGVEAWQRRDFDAAVLAWRPIAERGDAHAQFNLAQAYKLGRGVPADMPRAIALYRSAAAQGHGEAGLLLGLILFGEGRRQEAMPYVVAAAKAGEPSAQYVYGTALFNGDHVERDPAAAYAMMTRAAAGGIPHAAAALAEMDKHIPEPERRRGRAMAQADVKTSPTTVARTPETLPVRVATAASRPAPAVATLPAPAPREPSTAVAGRWRVQLGAFGQPANADALFTRLKGRVGVLRHSQPHLVRAGAVTRLQAGPFAGRAQAEDACGAMRAAGQACFVVAP